MKGENPVDALGDWHGGNRAREVYTRVSEREAAFDVIVIVTTIVVDAFIATYTHNL